jgi:DNA-binding GntR family transcriptional regulator
VPPEPPQRDTTPTTLTATHAPRGPRRPFATAAEFITDQLRNDIFTGRLKAGEPLPLEALAERFGTSVVPVREALRFLHAERYVVLRPHRTAQVAEQHPDELEELIRMQLLLLPEAIRRVHGKISAACLGELRARIGTLEQFARQRDLWQAFAMHIDFHLEIYAFAGPLLFDLTRRVLDETWRYRISEGFSDADVQPWVDQHSRLLDELESGTPASAVREIERHIEQELDITRRHQLKH